MEPTAWAVGFVFWSRGQECRGTFAYESVRTTLKRLADGLGKLANDALVALVPSPVAFFLSLHQAGLLKDRHVM